MQLLSNVVYCTKYVIVRQLSPFCSPFAGDGRKKKLDLNNPEDLRRSDDENCFPKILPAPGTKISRQPTESVVWCTSNLCISSLSSARAAARTRSYRRATHVWLGTLVRFLCFQVHFRLFQVHFRHFDRRARNTTVSHQRT